MNSIALVSSSFLHASREGRLFTQLYRNHLTRICRLGGGTAPVPSIRPPLSPCGADSDPAAVFDHWMSVFQRPLLDCLYLGDEERVVRGGVPPRTPPGLPRESIALLGQIREEYGAYCSISNGPAEIMVGVLSPCFSFQCGEQPKRVPLLLHKLAAIRCVSNEWALKSEEEMEYFERRSDFPEVAIRQLLLNENGRRQSGSMVDMDQPDIQIEWEKFPETPIPGHEFHEVPTKGAVPVHPCDVIGLCFRPPYGRVAAVAYHEKILNELLFQNWVNAEEELPDLWVWAKTSDPPERVWDGIFKYGREWWGIILVTVYVPRLNAVVGMFANYCD